MRAAVLFLVEHPGRELDDMGIGDVSRFMTRHCRLVSPKSVERLATGLRSFMGFALLEGVIVVPLAGAVPSAARWSGAALPRVLPPDRSRRCWPAATGAARSAGATTPSWCCSPASGCEPPKSRPSASMTSTGEPGRS